MVLDTRNLRLIMSIELTELEFKLLSVLSNNEYNSGEDIAKRVYDVKNITKEEYKEIYRASMCKLITGLRNKGLNIVCIRDNGYRLDDNIYVK